MVMASFNLWGLAAFFFVALANHWWQTHELDEAINIANANTENHTNRIVYGQSMGGMVLSCVLPG